MRYAGPSSVPGDASFGLYRFDDFNRESGADRVEIEIIDKMRTSSIFRRPGPTDVGQKCP